MKTVLNANRRTPCSIFVTLALAMLLGSCASYGPYHANTATEPSRSVRGPADGRYKMAFIEFGDQAHLWIIRNEKRLLKSSIKRSVRSFSFTFTDGKTTPLRAT